MTILQSRLRAQAIQTKHLLPNILHKSLSARRWWRNLMDTGYASTSISRHCQTGIWAENSLNNFYSLVKEPQGGFNIPKSILSMFPRGGRAGPLCFWGVMRKGGNATENNTWPSPSSRLISRRTPQAETAGVFLLGSGSRLQSHEGHCKNHVMPTAMVGACTHPS